MTKRFIWGCSVALPVAWLLGNALGRGDWLGVGVALVGCIGLARLAVLAIVEEGF